jgi:hypothetical protein
VFPKEPQHRSPSSQRILKPAPQTTALQPERCLLDRALHPRQTHPGHRAPKTRPTSLEIMHARRPVPLTRCTSPACKPQATAAANHASRKLSPGAGFRRVPARISSGRLEMLGAEMRGRGAGGVGHDPAFASFLGARGITVGNGCVWNLKNMPWLRRFSSSSSRLADKSPACT